MMRSLFVLAVVIIFNASGTVRGGEGDSQNAPSKEVRELAPLKYWAGDFVSQTESPVRTKGSSSGEWILAGRFLKFTFTEEASEAAPKLSGSLTMTYDVAEKAYRYWSFFSDGSSLECVGEWDADSRTMTWTGNRPAGFVQTYKASFDKDGGSTWRILITDKEGNTAYESHGTTKPVTANAQVEDRPQAD